MASTGISGTGLAVAAAGVVLIYSGVQNQKLIDSLRFLAAGKPIPAGAQNTATTAAIARVPIGGGNNAIVNLAATYKGRRYVFGGGHQSFCPTGGMDCSGYVSCVLYRLGLLKGRPLTTGGLSSWGVGVAFANRQPGDVLVWNGGPGGGHCGIVIDATTMWHNPCTACGGVQVGRYASTRTGRATVVRRAKIATVTV